MRQRLGAHKKHHPFRITSDHGQYHIFSFKAHAIDRIIIIVIIVLAFVINRKQIDAVLERMVDLMLEDKLLPWIIDFNPLQHRLHTRNTKKQFNSPRSARAWGGCLQFNDIALTHT